MAQNIISNMRIMLRAHGDACNTIFMKTWTVILADGRVMDFYARERAIAMLAKHVGSYLVKV